MDVLSPFIPVLCHSDRLFQGESCPRLDVVHPGLATSLLYVYNTRHRTSFSGGCQLVWKQAHIGLYRN